jgi:hypothetical protein
MMSLQGIVTLKCVLKGQASSWAVVRDRQVYVKISEFNIMRPLITGAGSYIPPSRRIKHLQHYYILNERITEIRMYGADPDYSEEAA